MKIAKVIVDVPSNQTDRPFDYLIPSQWEEFVQAGMRVVVPFGVRKLQGFVIDISDHSELKKLKTIGAILDPQPVLTKELLALGQWLAKQTLCFSITAYSAMLPAAMKAKYDKEVHILQREKLAKEVLALFYKKEILLWQEIEQDPIKRKWIQQEIKNGHLEIVYKVREKGKKKKIRVVQPAIDRKSLQQFLQSMPAQASKQKEIIQYFSEHPEPIAIAKLTEILQTTDSPIKGLISKGILQLKEQEVYRDPYDGEYAKTTPLPLKPEQKLALDSIVEAVREVKHEVFLLYGITGSGKTEVYMQAIDEALAKGKEAIVLVPEISLTPMMVQRFKGRFGSHVAVLHSGLSIGEKYDEWRKIQRKEVKVVVGARSAIFAPFENLGIIIIDEEHEASYKQEENPRYHARDVAIYRGRYHRCPVVLGSATPSLETFARSKKNVYRLLTLKERHNDHPMPQVEIVDMRDELQSGNRSMFSRILFEKLKERVAKGEQSVLFLNRRGFSTFVMCRNCGETITCPHCDISLTYHKVSNTLKCHYCSFEVMMPSTCPECQSEHIRFFGTGTQKVEEELAKILPEARVIRMDVDTTRTKGAHERLLTAFEQKRADILLGTQMIAKGLDFPDVTLVGVLAADAMLHIPDFRATEKTFQLLTQVSGRAGRHQLPGEVIIQTYSPKHYSVQYASKHDFDSFYETEMRIRKMYNYPPFYYLTLISVSHPDLLQTVNVAQKIVHHLKLRLSKQSLILGPVASPIARIKNRYRYHCMIKYKNEENLYDALRNIIAQFQKEIEQGDLQVHIDMNPYMLM